MASKSRNSHKRENPSDTKSTGKSKKRSLKKTPGVGTRGDLAADENPHPGACDARVEVTQVRAFQPVGAETPRAVAAAGGNFAGVVRGNQPVAFEVSFRVCGLPETAAAGVYSAVTTEIHAYNRTRALSERVTASKSVAIQAGEQCYSMRLEQSTLRSGTYRLECSAALDGSQPLRGQLKVPFLRVA